MIEPGPSTVRVQSPNHWTTREFSGTPVCLILEGPGRRRKDSPEPGGDLWFRVEAEQGGAPWGEGVNSRNPRHSRAILSSQEVGIARKLVDCLPATPIFTQGLLFPQFCCQTPPCLSRVRMCLWPAPAPGRVWSFSASSSGFPSMLSALDLPWRPQERRCLRGSRGVASEHPARAWPCSSQLGHLRPVILTTSF